MKKLILILLISTIGIYWLSSDSEDDGTLSDQKSQIEIPNPRPAKKVSTLDTPKESQVKESDFSPLEVKKAVIKAPAPIEKNKPVSSSEIDKFKVKEKVALEIDQRWHDRAEILFINELGLTEEEFLSYKKLKAEYHAAKMDALESFYEDQAEEDNIPSTAFAEQEEKITQDFHFYLREKLGMEKYNEYLESLGRFNEEINRDYDAEVMDLEIQL